MDRLSQDFAQLVAIPWRLLMRGFTQADRFLSDLSRAS
jgi:hypothetical protein